MINIVICDDDVKLISKIQQEIKEKIETNKNIYVYNGYSEEFKSYINNNMVHTIFILDIDLKDKDVNGFYIAKKIRKIRNYNDEIIFFSSYGKYIHDLIGSLIRPVAYLLKNSYSNSLLDAIKTASSFLETKSKYDDGDSGEIIICEFKTDFRIKFKDIIFIEKIKGDKYLRINVSPNPVKNEYKVLYNIGSIMNKLDDRFHWINRGVIANKNYIKYVDVKNKMVGLISGNEFTGASDNLNNLSTIIRNDEMGLKNE